MQVFETSFLVNIKNFLGNKD